MSWARLEDDFHSHPKVEAAGNSAVGLFVRAICYCAHYHTGGFVPASKAREFGSRADIQNLIDADLWAPVRKGDVFEVTLRRDTGGRPLPDATVVMPRDGYFIDEFLHFHPTKEEARERRARRAEAGSRGGTARQANAEANAQASATAPAQANLKHKPDPTRKDLQPNPVSRESLVEEGEFHALRLLNNVRDRYRTEALRREVMSYAYKLPAVAFQSVIDSLEKNRGTVRDEAKWVVRALARQAAERAA